LLLSPCNPADKGLEKLTTLDNLRVLKLKPNPYGVGVGQPGVPMANYLEVSRLTQLNSLTVALPVLHIDMMKSIGKLTGLQVIACLVWHPGATWHCLAAKIACACLASNMPSVHAHHRLQAPRAALIQLVFCNVTLGNMASQT
jgi:hypothetical protein